MVTSVCSSSQARLLTWWSRCASEEKDTPEGEPSCSAPPHTVDGEDEAACGGPDSIVRNPLPLAAEGSGAGREEKRASPPLALTLRTLTYTGRPRPGREPRGTTAPVTWAAASCGNDVLE